MSVSIEKMDGVDSVQVSLTEGLARIQLKPGNKLRFAQLRKIVAEKGFTPKEAHVTVVGEVISTADGLQLKVSEVEETFNLSFASKSTSTDGELQEQIGQSLRIEGVIPSPKEEEDHQLLRIIDFSETE